MKQRYKSRYKRKIFKRKSGGPKYSLSSKMDKKSTYPTLNIKSIQEFLRLFAFKRQL